MFTGDTNWLVLPRSLQSNLVSSRCSHWRSPSVPPPAALSVASAFSGEGASSPLPAAAFLMLEMEGSLKTPLLSTLFTQSPWLPWGWHAHTHLTSLPSHCPRQVNKGVNSQGTRMCHWQQWEATAKAQGTRCQYVIAVLLQEVGGKGCRELDNNTIYHRDSFPPPLAQSMITKECTSHKFSQNRLQFAFKISPFERLLPSPFTSNREGNLEKACSVWNNFMRIPFQHFSPFCFFSFCYYWHYYYNYYYLCRAGSLYVALVHLEIAV